MWSSTFELGLTCSCFVFKKKRNKRSLSEISMHTCLSLMIHKDENTVILLMTLSKQVQRKHFLPLTFWQPWSIEHIEHIPLLWSHFGWKVQLSFPYQGHAETVNKRQADSNSLYVYFLIQFSLTSITSFCFQMPVFWFIVLGIVSGMYFFSFSTITL